MKKWTPAQRAKFKATMAAKRNGNGSHGQSEGRSALLADLEHARKFHAEQALKLSRAIAALS